jgi:BioD-like phosphotransacetylase family protein
MVKVLTKKETLKTAIKTIIKDIYEDGMHKETLKPISGKYIDLKANEIIKEVSIRFPMGG